MTNTPYILVLEDHDDLRATLLDALDYSGYRARGFSCPKELLDLPDLACELEKTSAILTDGTMPGKHGTELARELRAEYDCTKPVILCTADSRPAQYLPLLTELIRTKSGKQAPVLNAILQKPVSLDSLKKTLDTLIQNH